MFIGRRVEPSTNSVRRSGIRAEFDHSRTIPLLRTEPEVCCSPIYKHVTLRGESNYQ